MNRTTQGLIAMMAGIASALVLTGIASATGPGVEEAVSNGLRWTGRLAFFVFLVPWFASPLRSLFPGEFADQLLRLRRQAGMGSPG